MKRTLIVLTMALVVSVALALVRPGAVQSEAAAAESGSDAASSDAGALRRLRLDGAVEILAANSARLVRALDAVLPALSKEARSS